MQNRIGKIVCFLKIASWDYFACRKFFFSILIGLAELCILSLLSGFACWTTQTWMRRFCADCLIRLGTLQVASSALVKPTEPANGRKLDVAMATVVESIAAPRCARAQRFFSGNNATASHGLGLTFAPSSCGYPVLESLRCCVWAAVTPCLPQPSCHFETRFQWINHCVG